MIKVITSFTPNASVVCGDIIVSDIDEADKALQLMYASGIRPSKLSEALEDECPGYDVIPWDSDDDIPIYGNDTI